MLIADSARKHGIADDDIHHAVRNAIREVALEARALIIGPSTAGELLEIVVLDAEDDDDEPIAIHAMPLRPKFHRYL
ncbi:MAG: hypothetical protein M3527_00055 [Actinomycetota bacterium]|nr:hypothetical protein [Acidimicrobiia bacterium]MDQ3292834.1 hypothetical protein [Actinomycetota bacterium]